MIVSCQRTGKGSCLTKGDEHHLPIEQVLAYIIDQGNL